MSNAELTIRLRQKAGFTAEDLAANQQGMYTPRQIEQMVKELEAVRRNTRTTLVMFPLFAAGCGVLSALGFAETQIHPCMIVGMLIVIVIVVGVVNASWQLSPTPPPNPLPLIIMVEGVAKTGTIRTKGGSYDYVRINRQTIYLPLRHKEAFQDGGVYRIFYRNFKGGLVFLSAELLAPKA